jgi:hypothetical protein
MRRQLLSLGAVILTGGLLGTPSASAQQSVNFFVGGFVPTSFDARDNQDVLVNNYNFLNFRIDRFKGPTVGGEYLAGLGDFFEAGFGLRYYQQTVPAFDINYVNTNGSNINADLKLRVVPFDATFRLLPLGHRAPIVPYIGGGVGIYVWRYSESGQFVDYTPPVPKNPPIFSPTSPFVGSGTAVGPEVVGGIRVPIGPFAPGFELRWQSGKGDLPANQSFSGTKIDLGGMNYLFTFDIRF